jgi:hypothetical protein
MRLRVASGALAGERAAAFPWIPSAQVPIGDPEDDEGGIGYDDEDDEDDDESDEDSGDDDDEA